ncbi:MAG: alkaline phosphatase family protein [Ginsengibacter sp.]
MSTSITPIPMTPLSRYANLRIYKGVTLKVGDPAVEIGIPKVTVGTITIQLLTLKGINGPNIPSGPSGKVQIVKGNTIVNNNDGKKELAIEGEGTPMTFKAPVKAASSDWKVVIKNTGSINENDNFPNGQDYHVLIVYPSNHPIRTKSIPVSFWQRAFDGFWNAYKPVENIQFDYNHHKVADQYSIGELLYAVTTVRRIPSSSLVINLFNVPEKIYTNGDIVNLFKYHNAFSKIKVLDKFGDPNPSAESDFIKAIHDLALAHPADHSLHTVSVRVRDFYRLLADVITSDVLVPKKSNKVIITVNDEIAKVYFLNAKSEPVKNVVTKITDGNFGGTLATASASVLLKVHNINVRGITLSMPDALPGPSNLSMFEFNIKTDIESEGNTEVTLGIKTDGGIFDISPAMAVLDAATDVSFNIDLQNITLNPEIGIHLVKPLDSFKTLDFERIDKDIKVYVEPHLDFDFVMPGGNLINQAANSKIIRKATNGLSLQDFLDIKIRDALENILNAIGISTRMKQYLLGEDYPILDLRLVNKRIQITYVGSEENEDFEGIHQTAPYIPPKENNLSKINHIVVLTMENRSFDQMLGYLTKEEGRTDVNGLDGSEANIFGGEVFPVFHIKDTQVFTDPCHAFSCMEHQIGTGMDGFVNNLYVKVIDDKSVWKGEAQPWKNAMGYYGKAEVPTNDYIANEFAICDKWYCSHPGQTIPNRIITYTGKLNTSPSGETEVDNPDFSKLNPIDTLTIFDYLSKCNVPWKVFEHGYSLIRLFSKYTYDTTNVVDFNNPVSGFKASLKAIPGNNKAAFPSVVFIEPDYIDVPPGADDHVPSDIKKGQKFIAQVIKELQQSGIWEKTLLIITYDENGGFYDHVMPPNTAIELKTGVKRFGPRVPAFVISPYVPAKTVSHVGYDHTSILATIIRRFITPELHGKIDLGPRVKSANDVGGILSLKVPRKDYKPVNIPAYPVANLPNYKMAIPAANNNDFHESLFGFRLITGFPPK